VTLVAFSDLSTGDIAHALGISESTVRVHLARARARLRSETASE
jgi:DNA-directed RNA polymerase specialized sigma24 family protein